MVQKLKVAKCAYRSTFLNRNDFITFTCFIKTRYKNLNMNFESFAHIADIKKLQNPGFFKIIPNLFLHHICRVQLISGIYLLIYGPNLNMIIGTELKWHGNGNLLCLNLNSNNQTIIRLFGSVLPIHRHHQALKWKKEEVFKGDPFISKYQNFKMLISGMMW